MIAETVACTLAKLLDDEDITANTVNTSSTTLMTVSESYQFLSEISKTLVPC